jgi:hypothetical protein
MESEEEGPVDEDNEHISEEVMEVQASSTPTRHNIPSTIIIKNTP